MMLRVLLVQCTYRLTVTQIFKDITFCSESVCGEGEGEGGEGEGGEGEGGEGKGRE